MVAVSNLHRTGRDRSVGPCFRFGRGFVGWVGLFAFLGCGSGSRSATPDAGRPDAQLGWASEPALPEGVANNAVAGIETEGGCMLFSISGIDASLTSTGIHNRGFRWRAGDSEWMELPALPGPARLATNAVGLRGDPYVLGGYEVQGGGEVSSTRLQRFNLQFGRWEDRAPLPIPIDDAGVAVWRDRYIVVVSGWSNTAPVSAVQIYDVESDSWFSGTDFPGTRVFGQAMAVEGDELVFIDGVSSGGLGFRLVNQAWRGELSFNQPSEIIWTDLGEHVPPARYRAAAGTGVDGALYFHGGTSEPYNFDGLRYDNGLAAAPLASTLRYAAGAFTLEMALDKPVATMDHRGLAPCGDRFFAIGGMTEGPEVTSAVWSLAP